MHSFHFNRSVFSTHGTTIPVMPAMHKYKYVIHFSPVDLIKIIDFLYFFICYFFYFIDDGNISGFLYSRRCKSWPFFFLISIIIPDYWLLNNDKMGLKRSLASLQKSLALNIIRKQIDKIRECEWSWFGRLLFALWIDFHTNSHTNWCWDCWMHQHRKHWTQIVHRIRTEEEEEKKMKKMKWW